MNVRWIIVITCGTIAAAPTPCANRNTMSEPSTSHQQHRVGDHIPGHYQLQSGAVRVQIRADGRDRDIDDRGVEYRHELPDQEDDEHGDRTPSGRRGMRCERGCPIHSPIVRSAPPTGQESGCPGVHTTRLRLQVPELLL
ncbi:hypothetical protein [Nocardia sp. NPDC004415]